MASLSLFNDDPSDGAVIYQPKGQAGEYAAWATNPYRGCGNQCSYCYVPLVTKQRRQEFDAGAIPRKEFLKRLEKDCQKLKNTDFRDQVMLSFTTDPYHPGDTNLTRNALECFVKHGIAFCTLTKGGTRAFRDIKLFRPERDAFASTITSVDADFSKKWERAAADPEDRMEALKAFHDKGIFTWVSLEPTLDCESSMVVMRKTHRYVDLFKIGRANYLPITKTIDWRDYTNKMVELCIKLDVRYYFKKDLQPFLPAGFDNPLRIPQHN